MVIKQDFDVLLINQKTSMILYIWIFQTFPKKTLNMFETDEAAVKPFVYSIDRKVQSFTYRLCDSQKQLSLGRNV